MSQKEIRFPSAMSPFGPLIAFVAGLRIDLVDFIFYNKKSALSIVISAAACLDFQHTETSLSKRLPRQ